MKKIFLLLFFSLFTFNNSYADKVIWSGSVSSDGDPTKIIQLEIGKEYQIKASGEVELGKWWQGGKKLINDACYEYNDKVAPSKLNTLLNSMNIEVCDGKYHSDHIYTSKTFKTKQSVIHFWVYDTDYNDNSGTFQVQITEIEKK